MLHDPVPSSDSDSVLGDLAPSPDAVLGDAAPSPDAVLGDLVLSPDSGRQFCLKP